MKKILYVIIVNLLLLELFSFLLLSVSPSIDGNVFLSYLKKTHPFLGFTDQDINLSNQFLKENDSSVYSVGIFGGSVAKQFCHYEEEFGYLKKRVSDVSGPSEIICFASGATRQPQQFITYQLYGGHLDFTIFIEGANETQGIVRKRGAPEWPDNHIFYVGENVSIKNSANVLITTVISKFFHWGASNEDTKINFFKVLKSLAVRLGVALKLYNDKRFLNLPSNSPVSSEVLEKVWETSLIKLDKAVQNQTIVIIQPFPQFKLNLTHNEKRYLEEVEGLRFQDIQSSISRISSIDFQNLKLISMHDLFKDELAEVFIDYIHLNNKGLQALTSNLSQAILENRVSKKVSNK